jgi:hypothetical protein
MRGSRATLASAGIAIAILLSVSGCAGSPTPQATPIALRLVDIQSGTVRVELHQVILLDVGDSNAKYTAEIANPKIVSVVEHRDEADGRFEPELVPRRVGATQVALLSSIPGHEVIGFTLVVSPDGTIG